MFRDHVYHFSFSESMNYILPIYKPKLISKCNTKQTHHEHRKKWRTRSRWCVSGKHLLAWKCTASVMIRSYATCQKKYLHWTDDPTSWTAKKFPLKWVGSIKSLCIKCNDILEIGNWADKSKVKVSKSACMGHFTYQPKKHDPNEP